VVDIISFVGILLSILLLFFIRNDNKSNVYLSGFYFIISLIALSRNSVFLEDSSIIYKILNPYAYPLFYCAGPFLYLYIKKSFDESGDQKLKTHEYLYFLPVLIVFINFSPQFFLPSADHEVYYREIKLNPLHLFNTKFLFFSLKINSILRPLCNLFFTVAGFLLVLKNADTDDFFEFKNTSKKFIQTLIYLYFLQGLLFGVISLTLNIGNINNFQEVDTTTHTILWILSIINLAMYLLLFLYPETIYGIFRFPRPVSGNIQNLNNLDFDGGEKLEQSYRMIGEKLEVYFQSKPYLQSGFNLSNIARETQIPYNQITLFFQVYLKVNFSDWKNSARIDHAKDLISNGQAKNQTLEAIALSCGYLSRSNFISSFKKYTGKNPSDFIKDLPEETFNKNLDF
jgi:AraC-like DNA-binding protein